MSLFYMKYRLNLKEQEIDFLNMFITLTQSLSFDLIQKMFKNHFNKEISRKTIIGYFNYLKVQVSVDYDLHFAFDYEPPKLKFKFNKILSNFKGFVSFQRTFLKTGNFAKETVS